MAEETPAPGEETVVEYRLRVIESTVGGLGGKIDQFLEKFITQDGLDRAIKYIDQKQTDALKNSDDRHVAAVKGVRDDVDEMKRAAKDQADRTAALEAAKRGRRSSWAIFWATSVVAVFGSGVAAIIYALVQAASHLTGSPH